MHGPVDSLVNAHAALREYEYSEMLLGRAWSSINLRQALTPPTFYRMLFDNIELQT